MSVLAGDEVGLAVRLDLPGAKGEQSSGSPPCLNDRYSTRMRYQSRS